MPATAMRTGGVCPGSRFDHVGIVAVAGAAAPVVYGPADTGPHLHAMLDQADSTGALEADHLAELLGPRASRVLGPAWYGYATAGSLRAPHSTAVRPLAAADLPLLARLHEQTPPAQREESGTTGLPAFGYLEDGALLAVACLGTWQQMPTIGVLTHPRARRRGLAHAVVAAAAREASTAGLSSSTVPGGPTPPRSLSPPKPASHTTATASSSTSARESVSGYLCGRRVRGFAIDLIPELVRTGRA